MYLFSVFLMEKTEISGLYGAMYIRISSVLRVGETGLTRLFDVLCIYLF